MSVSVSIIVPCYNVAAYLDQCMESLAGQSMEDIEIICVNDGSSDCTAEILREWRNRDRRVRIIDQKNSGVSAARNSGMAAAAGTYIGFVDPDDMVERNMFQRLVTAAAEKEADVAVCGYHEFCDCGDMDMPERGWSPSAGFFPEEKAERFRRGTPWSRCAGTVKQVDPQEAAGRKRCAFRSRIAPGGGFVFLFDAVDCCSAAPDPSRPFVPLPEGTPRFRLLRAGSPPGGFPHGFDAQAFHHERGSFFQSVSGRPGSSAFRLEKVAGTGGRGERPSQSGPVGPGFLPPSAGLPPPEQFFLCPAFPPDVVPQGAPGGLLYPEKAPDEVKRGRFPPLSLLFRRRMGLRKGGILPASYRPV